MISFDTNYLLRHLVQDDPGQARQVAQVIAKEKKEGRRILLLNIVLCETAWVLTSVYKATREEVTRTVEALLNDSIFVFESQECVNAAIKSYASGKADFSDYLIVQISKQCGRELRTFDKDLSKEF